MRDGTDATGRYLPCGVPNDIALTPSAWARYPGISVGPDADPLPRMRGATGNRCDAEVWMDGTRMQRITGWELRGLLLNAKRVELYNTATRVPADFTTVGMDPCGAILIWSH